jgi:hypothetical protein
VSVSEPEESKEVGNKIFEKNENFHYHGREIEITYKQFLINLTAIVTRGLAK